MVFKAKYNELIRNNEQKLAIDATENTVVTAGPGSGKTRIATLKAGAEIINGAKVACVSYSTVAAEKMRNEFLSYGIPEENILFGTVHSFSINYIIRRYFPVYKSKLPKPWCDLPDKWYIPTSRKIEEFRNAHLPNIKDLYQIRNGRYDSSLYVQDGVDEKLKRYDRAMIQNHFLDFDMIAELAYILLREVKDLGKSLKYHFDWLIIDEYQDLGTMFHRLIENLAQNTSIRFLVVGDADQAIHMERGGEYLTSLYTNLGFHHIQTSVCYRYNQKVIDKANIILDAKKRFVASEDVYSNGNITCVEKKLSEKELVFYVINKLLLEILEKGAIDNLGNIAILYPQRVKTSIPEYLVQNLQSLKSQRPDFDFVHEGAIRLSKTPLIEWIQSCADWCYSDASSRPKTFQILSNYYEKLYWNQGYPLNDEESKLYRQKLYKVLTKLSEGAFYYCSDWVRYLLDELNIKHLIRNTGDVAGELLEVETLYEYDTQPAEVLATSYNLNKVAMTTIHSAKGRQFKYVIVLGMQLGLVPWVNFQGQTQRMPYFRRLAYVSCTRATHQTYIVVSPLIPNGISPIIKSLC